MVPKWSSKRSYSYRFRGRIAHISGNPPWPFIASIWRIIFLARAPFMARISFCVSWACLPINMLARFAHLHSRMAKNGYQGTFRRKPKRIAHILVSPMRATAAMLHQPRANREPTSGRLSYRTFPVAANSACLP